MKTKTCLTYEIAKSAPKQDEAIIKYWIDLPESHKALFDNLSDFLMAVNAVN